MTLHLLRHELRRHPVLYPLAALLIFGAQFLPGPITEGAGTTLIMLVVVIGAIAIHPFMLGHPWHDHRAFWRTRPIQPRQLLAGQSLGIAIVIVLPVLAGSLLRTLPLNLGALPTMLAIAIPLAISVAGAAALASCAAFAKRSGRPDPTPYLAVFVAPLLSAAAYGFVHMFIILQFRGPSTEGENLTSFLLILAIAVAAALTALLVGTLKRKRRAGISIMFVAGIALPWIAGIVSFDLFRPIATKRRTLEITIEPAAENQSTKLHWTGLGKNEFFAPRIIHSSWTADGKHVAWMWPRNHHSSGPDFQPDILRSGQREPLQKQHNQFAAAVDVPLLWSGIRSRLPHHSTWRTSERPPRLHEPIRLGKGSRQPKFWLSADGEVFRLEALDPVSSITTGRISTPGPGRLKIRTIASDDSKIAILLHHQVPNPSLGSGFSASPFYSTAPPEFWAVLLHDPSSTAYACHGLRTRTHHIGNEGMIIHSRHHLLSFTLPKLETKLIGLDPQRLLAESTLHLFQAVPIARGEAKLDN